MPAMRSPRQSRHLEIGWRRLTPRRILALAGITALAACSGGPADKTGAPAHARTTLRILMPEGGDPEGTYFVAAVARRSNSRIKVTVDSASFTSADPASEAGVVAGLRSGRGDLGFVTARNWAAAGDQGFQAVLTPFGVTTLDLTIRLSHNPIAKDLLDGLAPTGIVGLALVPGEPRQLLSTRPLFGPTLGQARIRIVDNPQTTTLLDALAAVPVSGLTARETFEALRSRSIVGAETSPIYTLANSYNSVAHHLTAYALLPKMSTIVATDASWRRLSAADRKALTQAAADTVTEAEQQLPKRLTQELTTLCSSGVALGQVPASDLSALARAGQAAVLHGPRADTVREAIAALPGSGPQPQVIGFPDACAVARTADEAVDKARPDDGAEFVHRGGATIPPGVYVTTNTPADLHAGGVYGPESERDLTTTTTIHADGTYEQPQNPQYPGQPIVRGRYTVVGDTVTFTADPDAGLTPEVVRWSYYQGRLTFRIVNVQDSAGVVLYTAHPWRKIR